MKWGKKTMKKKLKIHENSTQKNGRADLGSGTLGPKGEGCFFL